jgi:hypothetical protein
VRAFAVALRQHAPVSSARRSPAHTAPVVVVVGAALLAAYLLLADDRSEAASVIGTLLAVVTAVSGVVPKLRGTSRSVRAGPAQLQDELDEFAAALRTQWSTEAAARGLVLPAPIKVAFTWTRRAVADDLREVRAHLPAGTGPRPVAGVASPTGVEVLTEGTIDQLHEIYAGLPSGRLVIMGAAGTGKSGAAVLLLLTALEHRTAQPPDARSRIPVPVLLSIGEWLPREQPLLSWVTARLLRDYAFLRRTAAQDVRQLVEAGSIALFLDGLDELAEADRVAAVQSIARPSAARVVLTTRPDEFEVATAEGHISGAAVVELRHVDPESAAQYLLSNRTDRERARWADVVARFGHPDGHVVAAALSTPLMLSIARTSYGRAEDPRELLDAARFPDVAAVEAYLLGRVVPAAYADDDEDVQADAERWLRFMAHRLSARGSHDLEWWRLPLWVSPWARLPVLAVALLGASCAVLAVAALLEGTASPYLWTWWWLFLPLLPSTLLLATTAVFGPPVRRSRSGGRQRRRLHVSVPIVATWLVLSPVAVVLGRVEYVLAAAFLAAVFTAAGLFGDAPNAVRLTWPSARRVVQGVRLGLVVGLVVALIDGRLLVGEHGDLSETATRITYWLASGALFGALFGAVFSLVRSGQSKRVGGSPTRSWRNDLTAGLVIGGVSGLVWGTAVLAALVGESLRDGASPGIGARGNLWEGLAALPVWIVAWVSFAVLSTGAVRLALACLVLRARGRAPVRVLRFLEGACRRQVMRRVGGTYQFRHARLQEHLAQEYDLRA